MFEVKVLFLEEGVVLDECLVGELVRVLYELV